MAIPKRRQSIPGTYFVTSRTWGSRLLFSKEPFCKIFVETIFHHRGKKAYQLHAFVLMPDHFHLLLTPSQDVTLERAVQYIKGGSAHRIGKELDLRFPVWQRGFSDHRIRDLEDYRVHLRYIEHNPVKAKLCSAPADYAWCSSSGRFELDEMPQGLKPHAIETTRHGTAKGRALTAAKTVSEQVLEIRRLTESDLPAAMRLKELAGWNQTENDWRRLLRLEPRGCFAAWLDGRLVATTTTTSYRAELAWIGMVLVDPEYRRRGIATRLMRAALDYLRAAGVATIKLDATPAGQPVYEALGFGSEARVERWEGLARRAAAPEPRAASDARAWPEILELDRRAFGADRSPLLESLAADSGQDPLVIRAPDGPLQGYALVRQGTAASYLGPLVATDEAAARALVDAVLAPLAGQRVYIDWHTGFDSGRRLLAERGFSKQRDLIRMRAGAESRAGTSRLIFAIAGPEVG